MTSPASPRTTAGRALLDAQAPEYEPNPCKHKGSSWFDRSFCACGSMHDVCEDCSHAIGCPLNRPEAYAERRQQAAQPILAIEAEAVNAALDRLQEEVGRLPVSVVSTFYAPATAVSATLNEFRAVERAAVLALIAAERTGK